MKKKKLILRKCVGCQEMKDKKVLLRITKSLEGNLYFDETGKKDGRGAYICNNLLCFEKAQKNRGLERAFKTSFLKENYELLRKELNLFE